MASPNPQPNHGDPSNSSAPYPTHAPSMEQPPSYPGHAWGGANPAMAYPPGAAVPPPPGWGGGVPTTMTYPTQTFVAQPQGFTQVPVVLQQQQQPLRSPDPVRITCPYCHDEVTTKTKRRAGAYAWSAVGIIFLTGWFFILPWLFCWIPLCIPSFQDVHHKCPKCKKHLYTHSPM
ncbi:unnamed protein product [Lampetra planeri]